MVILLWIWGIVNVIGTFAFSLQLMRGDHWYDIFIYPMLGDWLASLRCPTWLEYVVKILFTIVFLPYLIVHMLVITAFALVVMIIVFVLDARDKRIRKW